LSSRKAPPTIFWDFDGTLVEGPRWSKIMLRVLDNNYPDHGITIEQIRAFLHEGFPWHNPEKSHPELTNPDVWWSFLENLLARVYRGIGYNTDESNQLAQMAHLLMLEPESYLLFEDTLTTLQRLSERGWRHVILSNHYPELPNILGMLPIKEYIYECHSSAITGYEKPHPEAFRLALEKVSYPKKVWMVGDNLKADVRGAEAAGIPAILVRQPPNEDVKFYAKDLLGAAEIIENPI